MLTMNPNNVILPSGVDYSDDGEENENDAKS